MIEFYALAAYVAVMSITPGPNNIMLAASGVNFGYRRTLPHILGISLGHALQLFITALLLATVTQWLDGARAALAVVGCSYLLWLSWKLLAAAAPDAAEARRPMSFAGAALFQWLNPKAWVMVINAALLFLPKDGPLWLAALLIALLSALVNFPCVSLWAWTGERLRHALQSPRALLGFNVAMAALMAATALWMLWDEFRQLPPPVL